MSLIASTTQTAIPTGDTILDVSEHGSQHTLNLEKEGSATGTVSVLVLVVGATVYEPLYDKGIPLVVDIASGGSYVFAGAINKVKLSATTTGTYRASLSSHGARNDKF